MPDFTVDAFDLDGAFAALEDELSAVAQGITVVAWNYLLQQTPQFFGRMAASWTYSLNSPEYVDRSEQAWTAQIPQLDNGPFPGLWAGHKTAIGIANAANVGRDRQFQLGDTVYFSNGADHGEGPYSGQVENGEVKLRRVNRPGRPAERTLDMVAQRFGVVSADRAAQLKTLKIGQ